jgi:hypothetical protein
MIILFLPLGGNMKHKPEPKIIQPFNSEALEDIGNHIKEVRRVFDWPGNDYHDKDSPKENLFNRWYWHNLPLLQKYHHSLEFIKLASDLAGQELKPSYCFLSMYGSDGICPVHTDRPQCQFTIDLQVHADGSWPIYVDEKKYVLENGKALFYSGTGQVHYRKSMKEDSDNCTFMNLAFFHFVPTSWAGQVG